ncbi:hypothetical protein ACQP1W_05915 [Spirillospora sp. CA-255316]
MPPATTRRHRPGFLFYYDEGVSLRRRRSRRAANAIRAVTICAVVALIHLIGLTLGPVLHS